MKIDVSVMVSRREDCEGAGEPECGFVGDCHLCRFRGSWMVIARGLRARG